MPQDKAMAVYGPKARKAEADELRSMELMKKIEKPAPKAMPKKEKPMAVYGPKARKAEADELASVKLMKAHGGKVKSASARADGCAIRGKTRAR